MDVKGTKIKRGSLVTLIKDLKDDPKYQVSMWEMDHYFLRDRFSLKISNVWIKQGDICIAIDQDYSGIVVLTPRGMVGWIGKEKMEIVT